MMAPPPRADKDKILDALARARGKTVLAAQMLEVSHNTLLRRMREHGIAVRRGRSKKPLRDPSA